MNKEEFIEAVSQKTLMTKKDTKAVVDAVLETITESLVKKEPVVFIGFGTFTTAKRAAREANIPSTGAKVQVPETTVAKFKVGKKLKELVSKA